MQLNLTEIILLFQIASQMFILIFNQQLNIFRFCLQRKMLELQK